MSTKIRPKLSKINKYYISKNKYYELKYFCLQYYEMKQELAQIDSDLYSVRSSSYISTLSEQNTDDKLIDLINRKNYIFDNILLIEQSCLEADADIYQWLLLGVTKNFTYDVLTFKDIPCSRSHYYKSYRKFFYILSKKR